MTKCRFCDVVLFAISSCCNHLELHGYIACHILLVLCVCLCLSILLSGLSVFCDHGLSWLNSPGVFYKEPHLIQIRSSRGIRSQFV